MSRSLRRDVAWLLMMPPRMGHPLRWYEPDVVYEFTSRTIREQFLLRPCPASRDLIFGVIGRAQVLYPAVRIHYFVFISNHSHMLLSSSDGASLAPFIGFVNSNVAREIGRLRGAPGRMWARRTRPIRIVDEASMVDRLRYLVSHGCKEGLVGTPGEWPGATAHAWFATGAALTGTWHHRDAERRALRRREAFQPDSYRTKLPITMSPLPCWRDLDERQHRARHAEIIAEITRTTAAENARLGRMPLGPDAICAVDPMSSPIASKRSPAPQCHAASRSAAVAYRLAYRAFVAAYRVAAKALREGQRTAEFPRGAFPCRAGFVLWSDAASSAPAAADGRRG